MNYCDQCETCAHCSKAGCIPLTASAPQAAAEACRHCDRRPCQCGDSTEARPCTCHPEDRPTICQRQYAASECQASAQAPEVSDAWIDALPFGEGMTAMKAAIRKGVAAALQTACLDGAFIAAHGIASSTKECSND